MMTREEIKEHNRALHDGFVALLLKETNAAHIGGYLRLKGVTIRVEGRWSTHSGLVTGLKVQVDGCYGYAPKVSYRIDKEEDFAHALHKVTDRCDVIAGHMKTAKEKSDEATLRSQKKTQANADVAATFLALGYKVEVDSFGRVSFASKDVGRLFDDLSGLGSVKP